MSRYKFPDGQTVRIGQGYARAGVNYPADWLGALTEAERDALGLAPVPEAPPVDPRFETVVETAPGVYETTPVPLADAKAAKLKELAARRFERETGGVVVAGLPIRTDRESQGLLVGAALAATLDANYTVDWKAGAGFVTLTATQLLGAAQAVRAHVQACFSAERAHAEAIDALATVEAVAAYDVSTGWPA